MESIMQYPDKGYDVEIWSRDNGFTADIKYPCGELVAGRDHLLDKHAAVWWAVKEVNKLGHAHHEGCTDEYCEVKK